MEKRCPSCNHLNATVARQCPGCGCRLGVRGRVSELLVMLALSAVSSEMVGQVYRWLRL